jgi:hypothetical protein
MYELISFSYETRINRFQKLTKASGISEDPQVAAEL